MSVGAGAGFVARLQSRGVVRVRGADAAQLLQSLMTSDVRRLRAAPHAAGAAAFLSGRGRVLFAALVRRAGAHDFLLDVERAAVPRVLAHLQRHRLRARAQLSDESHARRVWALVGAPRAAAAALRADARVFADPRLAALGLRAIADDAFGAAAVAAARGALREAPERRYTLARLLLGVPDGADFDGAPLPLDMALHLLNAVSFNKGCYLGQELTARTHFTGVLRKRVTPLMVGDAPSDAPELRLPRGAELLLHAGGARAARAAGTVSSSEGNVGLAVLRLADVFGADGAQRGALRLRDGRLVRAWQPEWWHAAPAAPEPSA